MFGAEVDELSGAVVLFFDIEEHDFLKLPADKYWQWELQMNEDLIGIDH